MNTWRELRSLNFVVDTPVVLTESWLVCSLLSCALDKPCWLTWFKPGFFDAISGMLQGVKGLCCPFHCSSGGETSCHLAPEFFRLASRPVTWFSGNSTGWTWRQQTWVLVPTLLFNYHMTLGKSFHCSASVASSIEQNWTWCLFWGIFWSWKSGSSVEWTFLGRDLDAACSSFHIPLASFHKTWASSLSFDRIHQFTS